MLDRDHPEFVAWQGYSGLMRKDLNFLLSGYNVDDLVAFLLTQQASGTHGGRSRTGRRPYPAGYDDLGGVARIGA